MRFENDRGEALRAEDFVLGREALRRTFVWEPKPDEFGDARFLEAVGEIEHNGARIAEGRLPILLWPKDEKRVLYKMPRALRLLPPGTGPAAPVLSLEDGRLTVTPLPEADDPALRVDLLYNMYAKGSPQLSRSGVNHTLRIGASPFNREDKPFFGDPPRHDIVRLRMDAPPSRPIPDAWRSCRFLPHHSHYTKTSGQTKFLRVPLRETGHKRPLYVEAKVVDQTLHIGSVSRRGTRSKIQWLKDFPLA